jgi:hypothetical protein
MDIGQLFFGGAMGAEHGIDQIAQTISFFNNNISVFMELGIAKLAGQSVRCTAQTAKGVFDFVGNAAD